jgi:serine/threonine protein kinase
MCACVAYEKDGKKCGRKKLVNHPQHCKVHDKISQQEQAVIKLLTQNPLSYSFVHDFIFVRTIDHSRLMPRLFLMILKKTNELFVLKKMRTKTSTGNFRPAVIQEMNLALKLQSWLNPYINHVLGVIHHHGDWYLMMEYCNAKTLDEWRDNKVKIIERGRREQDLLNYYKEACYFFYLLCVVVHQCHEEMHVVHRDIKLENVLLQQHDKAPYGYILKLADFELSADFHENIELVGDDMIRGTLFMHAPEFIYFRRSDSIIQLTRRVDYRKVDVWCLGVIFYQFLYPDVSYDALHYRLEAYKRTSKTLEEICDNYTHIPRTLLEMLHKMLSLDPEKRITMTELIDQYGTIICNTTISSCL